MEILTIPVYLIRVEEIAAFLNHFSFLLLILPAEAEVVYFFQDKDLFRDPKQLTTIMPISEYHYIEFILINYDITTFLCTY